MILLYKDIKTLQRRKRIPTKKQLANLKSNKPQNKHLKPIEAYDEACKLGRKGGIRSGEVRRQLKTFRELLMEQLSEENINRKTLKEALANKLLKLALSVNMKAIEMVRDTLGEKPKERIESETTVNKYP